MIASLLLLAAAAAMITALAAPSLFLRHNLTLPLLGWTDVTDRDADRVDAELRAIISMREQSVHEHG
ncbi:hypothetical protein NDR87_07985 [Nocardia sp. CDC159]|uniref:Uncharacterized protein n=1 Tax=Nocardia pulmonis TaxID=2951408 RepID=A0A9X2IWC3_9NOCA|nr:MULTISPECIES: hypothetical protein [Nocardia]MCM6773409.1 hypothetical protein [Nocardia pulmonis]MCM6786296.1 hypothetical protein [Nocardia sp. CDC159]